MNVPLATAVIAAVATIISAVIGAYFGNKGSLTGVLPGSPTQTVTVPGPTVTVTTSPPSGGRSPISPAPTQGQEVWRRDKMRLPSSTGIDIDAPSPAVVESGGDFYTTNTFDNYPGFDLYSVKAGTVEDGSPSLSECQEALISNATEDQFKSRAGRSFCVQTDSGERIAGVTVLSYDPKSYATDVAVTVWEIA